ncbi:MAG: SRPBCC family protein [Myxococcaceae bacterium]|nr:SRPBCC family protein [Myxococcaceae bacterium]
MTKIDVPSVVGAVTREVRTIQRDQRQARVVVATRVYETGLADAWDALTNAERLPRWFLPIEGELRQGGRYQLRGNAGGTITACEPQRHLAMTWEFGGKVSWLDVRLEPISPERTRLVLEHTAHDDDGHWNEFGPGATGVGWDLGLLGLDMHVTSGGASVTEEGVAWSASDDGKRLVRLASDDWCRASIAAGTDAAQARSAADRTSAFYTGGS